LLRNVLADSQRNRTTTQGGAFDARVVIRIRDRAPGLLPSQLQVPAI
jgi:hypothetical protein